MSDLKIALIGAGAIGQTHISTIHQQPGFSLVAIADPGPAAAQIADSLQVPWFASHKDMLDSVRPDGVIIATPNELHVDVSIDCLKRGIPVLLEKPVANTVSDAMRLVDATEQTGVPVLVGHHRRHNPIIKAAKKLIDDGALGRPVMASVSCALMKPADYFQIPWHREPAVGGPFLINLIHEIDLLRHLYGEIDRVAALKSSAVRGLDVEDSGGALLHFRNGAIASIALSDTVAAPWSWDMTSGEVERFPAHDALSHYLCGTEGGIGLPGLQLWRHDGNISWTEEMTKVSCTYQPGDPFAAQLQHFGELIARTAEPVVSVREATRNLEIVMALHRAAETGQTISLG